MIKLQSDLRISFDQIGIKFQSIVNDHREQLEEITRKIVEEFDFQTLLKEHIEEGLEKAFDKIDLSENLTIEIWNEINKRLIKEDKP